MASPAPRSVSGQLDQILPLVLEHAEDASSSPRTLCSLLQVSSTCRRAVQQSVGHCVPSCEVDSADPGLISLAELAAWLPWHAGLVCGLVVRVYEENHWGIVAQQLMVSAILACRRDCCDATAALAPAPAAPMQLAHSVVAAGVQPHPLPLMLRSYETDRVISPAVCSALVGCSSLTHLVLSFIEEEDVTPALCAALGTLTTLRSLEVNSPYLKELLPACFAEAVAPLCQLTRIEAGALPPGVVEWLPPSLQEAHIHVSRPEGDEGHFAAHMAHLTALASLNLKVTGSMNATSTLPSSLTGLTAIGGTQAQAAVGGWHQLQELQFDKPITCVSLLGNADLRRLQAVTLSCMFWNASDVARALQAVCSCTGVTELHLSGWTKAPGAADADWLLHKQLQRLPRLHSLHLNTMKMQACDVLGLTTLTGLASLDICICQAVCDADAVAIALNMPCLRHLGFKRCDGLSSDALWPAFAACTSLRSLSFCNNRPKVTAAALQHLSRATQLVKLSLFQCCCDGFDVASPLVSHFVAGMPHLTGIDWA